jgi:DNA-binding NarL/FixJ family response regulator
MQRTMKAPAQDVLQPAKKRLRILLVEDHAVVRDGLSYLLNAQPDMEICGTAATTAQAMRAVEENRPDFAIIDISLEGPSGIELLEDLKIQHPVLPVLVLSMHDENLYAERALRAGARGYLGKKQATETVLVAIRRILGGDLYVSDRLASKLLHRLIEQPDGGSVLKLLSDRELEIVTLIGQGRATRQIAEGLHLSVKTIESHRQRIKAKLKLEDGAELVRFAVQFVENGAVPLQEKP